MDHDFPGEKMLTIGLSTFSETVTVTSDNPLLHGHLVYGRALLPGVGYVDLVLQVLGRQGLAMSDIELRNLTILAPLVAEPGERLLTTVQGQPGPAGGCRIEVRSRRPQDSAEIVHAVVTAHKCEPWERGAPLGLPLLAGEEPLPLADVYAWFRERELVHSGLMKVDGVVHLAADGSIAELTLPSAHEGSAANFLFHPALFEAGLLGGGVGMHVLHENYQGDEVFLPLVFESFRATAPLGRHCFVRVPAASIRRDDELFRMAVEFYDTTGARIAEIGQLVAKRVRAAGSLDVRAGTTPTVAARVSPTVSKPEQARANADRGAEAVLRELVAARLDLPVDQLDIHRGFYELGLTSAQLVSLVPDLENTLALALSPTIVFEHRSVSTLGAWLRDQVTEPPADETAVPGPGGSAGSVTTAASHGTGPASSIAAVLVDEIAALLRIPADEVDPRGEFAECGLDVTGMAQLAARYGPPLTSAVFIEHRTVQAVARYLAEAVPESHEAVAAAPPHPMLHSIERDGEGVLCHVHFSGREPYLRDHRVRESMLLPAVAQLEMALAAVTAAAGEQHPNRVRLNDVVWLRPALCGSDGLDLWVRVQPMPGGTWEYSIERVENDGSRTVCSSGRATTAQAAEREFPTLAELTATCTERVIAGTEVYDLYSGVGMDYGPAQRSIVALRLGLDRSGQPQALAELRLPSEAESADRYRLHPSILDGALQATIGLALAAAGTDGSPADPALPFTVLEVGSLDVTPALAYAWIRQHPGRRSAMTRLDVTIFDESGRVRADLVGLNTRVLAAPPAAKETRPASPIETSYDPTDIAIVGVGGRYPEAADLDEFWHNLRTGRDCIREVPSDRWDHRRYADIGGSSQGKWGGFIDGIDRFDPLFFQISLLEADYLDPQERLFIQCAHHTLEDAGYTGQRLGRVGVFVGVMYQEYQLYGAQAQERGRAVVVSGSPATTANRVSYFFDFHGPSMTVDTMCSSSLTAIHLACEAIKSGQCDAALAGGVNISSHPNKFVLLSQRRFLSSDGRCRSFGEGGDGYVPGDGVGAVLLKSLARAIADGDQIHGVIKGTALNHGGRSSGYLVPSPAAQSEVITAALRAANVDPRAVSYVEAHGTGTSLGDPIEVTGLARAYQGPDGLPAHCAIGSVKSNIGHTESAAGIAGLTKVLLQMRHGELVPSLHSDQLNPRLDFGGSPPRVQQRVEPWNRPTVEIDSTPRTFPRIAGVSGFGAGGSNAHVIVSEYLPSEPVRRRTRDDRPALLILSAYSEAQVVEQARRLHARLGELNDDSIADVAWTLQLGRMALPERLAIAATSMADARRQLESFVTDPQRPGPWVRGTVQPGGASAARHAEPAVRSALNDWTANGDHGILLRLWAEGAQVDWAAASGSLPPTQTVSLPGYPFAEERCWFDIDGDLSDLPLLPGPIGAIEGVPAGEELLLFRPVSTERKIDPANTAAAYAEHHIVVIGRLTTADHDRLRAALPSGVDCLFITVPEGSLDQLYSDVAQQVFSLVRDTLKRGIRQPVLLQIALLEGELRDADPMGLACLRGLTGLLKTAHLETPMLRTQYLDCLDGAPLSAVAARLVAEASHGDEPEVWHRDGRRFVERWAAVPDSTTETMPWQENGVYLITGGAGGLGLIVATDIAASVRHATVVITGRSRLTDEKRSSLNALRAAGLTADYQQADVADRESMARVLAHVADNHGPLTGVLHSAGIIDDALIVRKNDDAMARVLAPKVAGLVNLDELTRDQPLSVFLCFSSTAGSFGNAGQADYATANAFMDAYAGYRNGLVEAGICSGRTVSVGWPLWDNGGMGDATVRANLESAGLAPLDIPRGLIALRAAMAARDNGLDAGRLLVLVGRRDAVFSQLPGGEAGAFGDTESVARSQSAPPAPSARDGAPIAQAPTTGPVAVDAVRGLQEPAMAHLRRLLAASVKLAPERLDVDTPLDQFGMDSVVAVNVISRLEETFGPLPRTLLFEEPTVRDLARYFVTEHPEALRSLVGEPAAPAPAPAPAPDVAGPSAPAVQATAAVTAPAVQTATSRTEGAAVENVGAETAGPTGGASLRGRDQDVAIIGMSGRYPQADNLDALWEQLRDGRDCITEIPPERWDHRQFDGAGRSRSKWGGFLDGVDHFDPLLFGISPRDARVMDPQQRLFLQTVWNLLEQNGITQEALEQSYERRVGVYVGAGAQMYRADESDPRLAVLTTSAASNLIANRVSHFFGLEGPSLAVDSMCSSSAVAIHLACGDLQRGETELAVAGGVNLTLHPDKYVTLTEFQLLGSTPGSRSFRDGDGYLPAEAVGAVLLKPLNAALRDGDTIHAVIKGTASMHSGRANGFMTPSHTSQVKVMRRALERADVEPDSIGYVEAAANGAALSDAVEVRALREVFGGVTEPVALGSVKSNLGHPEAASGIAQLTKVVLQLEHGQIVPLVEVGSPNPNISLDGAPVRICDRLASWEPRGAAGGDGRPPARRALINSIAAGGSYVSLVVEGPPPVAAGRPHADDARPQLVVLSARNRERLLAATQRLHDYLERDDSIALADIAYTSQVGRESQVERLAVVAGSRAQLRSGLAYHLARGLETSDGVDQNALPAVPVYCGNAQEDAGPLHLLLDGASGGAFLSALVTDRDLERLAELWVRGAKVPWRGLHDGCRRLVSLPTTLFEAVSYWVAQRPGVSGRADEDAQVERDVVAPIRPTVAGPADDASLTRTEQIVLATCAELLGFRGDEIGIRDDFFALGGHSLLIPRFIATLRSEGLYCETQSVFEAGTLAAIAAAVDAGTGARPSESAEGGGSIPAGCTRITPDMLPLAALTDDEIAAIVAAVPGGAANVQDVYPLAALQEGMLFHHLRRDGRDPYVLSGMFGFDSQDDLLRFADALRAVIARHDALRTAILTDGLIDPMQVVLRHVELPVEDVDIDLSGTNEDEAAAILAGSVAFALDRAPLIKLCTVRHPDTGGWRAILSIHHLIHDASSFLLLLAELVGQMGGAAEPLPAPPPYRDFIAHSRRRAMEIDPATFFAAQLADVTEPTVMFGLHDVHGDGSRTVELRRQLDDKLGRRIRSLARELRVSPAALFHAGWALVVAACSDRDTVVFGTVMSGRLQGPAGIEHMLGNFINTLPVRLDLANTSVRDLVRDTDRVLRDLVRYEQVPLSVARSHSGLAPEAPLFNAFFNYRHTAAANIPGEPGAAIAGVTPLSGVIERSNYPVAVSVDDRGDGFSVEALIDRAQEAGAVISYLETVLTALVDALHDEPDTERLALDLPMESSDVRDQVLDGFIRTSNDHRCLHTCFEEVAARRPRATAVTFGRTTVSYRELNVRANQLAHHLRDLGVGPDVLVALCLPRSEQMVIGMLAVLKAGGGYVPLDPASPPERLAHALADSAPHAVLIDGLPPAGVVPAGSQLIDVRADADRWATAPETDLPTTSNSPRPDDVAYVIYTSGSTGTPKGVIVEHRNVARLFTETAKWFRFGEDDVWTLFHSFSFDFSVWEIWGSLLHGGRLVIVPEAITRNPKEFYALLAAEGVTVLNQTPSAFRQLIAAQGEDGVEHRLRTVVFGGEALDLAALRPWQRRSVNQSTALVNMYGITETTVHVTYRPLTDADLDSGVSPIGVCLPDVSAYVLDRHGRPSPSGAVGELYVGGAGVARGYLNRPELTAERFLRDPFRDEPDARMYRTGDLVRQLPDGELEYLGRNDNQVKLRGFRVELGEIEARLAAHDGVEDARVVLRDHGDDHQQLVGYVVPSERHALPVREMLRIVAAEPDLVDRIHELPNGMPVFHHNRSETDFLYEEIFTNFEYLRHGVTIQDGDRIVDVGANIGMFTLFAGTRCPGATIYAFEPIPPVADSLRRNVELHGIDATVFAEGLGATATEETFTFYRHNTVLSSSRTTTDQAQALTRSYLRNQEESAGDEAVAADRLMDDVVGARLDSEQFTVRIRTLSEVMAEQGIDRVDLLKVDVENAEYEVLQGIDDRDWPRIRQLVVEVHDSDGRLAAVLSLLEQHGFEVVYEQTNRLLRNTALYNLYATRPAGEQTVSAADEPGASMTRGVGWSNQAALRDDLHIALSGSLPDYMLPTAYVFLDHVPLTRNGKLDHRALPDPRLPESSDARKVGPSTEAEYAVAAAWAELLHGAAGDYHLTDDFFALGGNSLLVTRLINLLKRQAGVELPVQLVFDTPQLGDLAAELARRVPGGGPASGMDVEQILAGLHLIENMSDEDLDALETQKSAPEGQA